MYSISIMTANVCGNQLVVVCIFIAKLAYNAILDEEPNL